MCLDVAHSYTICVKSNYQTANQGEGNIMGKKGKNIHTTQSAGEEHRKGLVGVRPHFCSRAPLAG